MTEEAVVGGVKVVAGEAVVHMQGNFLAQHAH